MTISQEKKDKILELREKGVNKSDISKTVEISYPTVNKIIKESKKGMLNFQNSNDDLLGEKLLESFIGDGWNLDDNLIQLVFNLKGLANKSNQSLKDFLEDIEYLIDDYYKLTNNPIDLFDYLIDISTIISKMNIESTEITDKLLELIENGVYLSDLEEKREIMKENAREEVEYYKEQKELLQKDLNKLAETRTLFLSKLLNKDSNEKLEKIKKSLDEALKKQKELEIENKIITETMVSLVNYFNRTPEGRLLLGQFKEDEIGEMNKI